ncbi:hypothetical protein Q1695_013453 [Nippostrongylus brasiliensis]|nr:hypothetical protein Q1695_013453 [Nippostrongylus brasiliensis]
MPSRTCVLNRIDIPLDKYKITYNKGHQFAGGNMTIFYESSFGLFPYYEHYNPDMPINGGLPQNVSLADHLERVAQQIQEKMPDANYSGLAVIDLEEWRPLWAINYGAKRVYRDMSIKLVQEKHPNLTVKEATKQAEKEFNEAARNFFVETLRLAKKLRPKALWGYYLYPFCDAQAGGAEDSFSCSADTQRFNDELDPIYNESTALFPSIYLNGTTDFLRNLRRVQAVLNETRRIANKRTPSTKIFVYTKIEYDPLQQLESFYKEEDLCTTLLQSSAYGANGVVVWSSSRNMTKRCSFIADYVDGKLGPAVLKVRAERRRCRRERCNRKGLCVLRERQKGINWTIPLDDYDCKCDKGYTGNDCSKKNP